MQGSDTLMAKFRMELPTELMQTFQNLDKNTEKMIGEMCEAGAEVVKENIEAYMPDSFFYGLGADNIITSRIYKTPSDGGINCQAMIVGYFTNENGKKTPAPLVANMFEYGSRQRKYPKHPFLRKSFRKNEIEKAMLDVQKKYIKED